MPDFNLDLLRRLCEAPGISGCEIVVREIVLADAPKIPYQLEMLLHGGTDAAAMQRARAGSVASTPFPSRPETRTPSMKWPAVPISGRRSICWLPTWRKRDRATTGTWCRRWQIVAS